MEPSEVARIADLEERMAQMLYEEQLAELAAMEVEDMPWIKSRGTEKVPQGQEPAVAVAEEAEAEEKLLVIDLPSIREAQKKRKKKVRSEQRSVLERSIVKTIRAEKRLRGPAPVPSMAPQRTMGTMGTMAPQGAPAATKGVMTSGQARRPLQFTDQPTFEGRGRIAKSLPTKPLPTTAAREKGAPRQSRPRPLIQSMDPEVERRKREVEQRAEAEAAAEQLRKRARPVRSVGPVGPVPPPVPSSLLAPVTSRRSGFGRAPAGPLMPLVPLVGAVKPAVASVSPFEVIRELKSLQNSLLDGTLILFLDPTRRTDIASVEAPGEMVQFLKNNLLPEMQRRIVTDLLPKLSDSSVRRALEAQFRWIRELAVSHSNWVMLQLEVLKAMLDDRSQLRCSRMEVFSERLVSYTSELVKLFKKAPEISEKVSRLVGEQNVSQLNVVLQNYLSRLFGTYVRLPPDDHVNRFITLINFIIGRERHIFAELLRIDTNCDADVQLRILENLKKAEENLLILSADDEMIKAQFERSLMRINDEITRLQSRARTEAEEELSYGDVPLDDVELEEFYEK